MHEITTNPLRGVEQRADGSHHGIYDHGAHAWAWQPASTEPVLWMSEVSEYAAEKPIRGGVPVCFPWFGPGRSGDLQPGHGFIRLAEWTRTDVRDDDEGLTVEYRADNSATGEQPNWPHRYEAKLRATFTDKFFEVQFDVTNTGDEEFSYEEAFHTYLAVGDVRECRVEGLEGDEVQDKLTGETRLQDGAVRVEAQTELFYRSTAEVRLVDESLGRTLVVSKEGSANTIVWNPWSDKAAAMPDFGDDEWPGMICIEAANARDDAITLAPGASHTLTQRITLA